ncbi:class I SAM-dependent methyltransferase [Jatrophihabitans endophyticus]|uniref:class I SAM-dependent methyltransferase n=1 Tax=Jatrophihabitans endophyticus TaxID=1206085 RepID=UPI001A072528|nr:class I SAM-dependent methyltransferase [Jatrophihabitans endophyticus]MBE7190329.1 class I SAM-dependent methyltransferase [Jatrophihabitans endophyticus]
MANDEAAARWADRATGWVDNQAVFDAIFAPVTRAILDAAGLAEGQRVLDVGCGTGTLLEAADSAGAAAVGVDISPAMVAAASARVPAAAVLLGDAQDMPIAAAAPGPPFDRVVSRFGVMFFADPVAAFANLRAAAAPGASLVFACWRRHDENPMFTLGSDVLAARLDPPPPPPEAGEPGPTAFADRDRLARVLSDAGWASPDITALDVTLDHGYDGSDGVENRVAIVQSVTTGRTAYETLRPAMTPTAWDALLDDVRTEVRRHLVDGAVRIPAALWLVTTRNPG